MDQMIKDLKGIYEYNTCIELLKRTKKISKRRRTPNMSDGEIEVLEDNILKEQADKIGFDCSIVYTLDIKILKKYLTFPTF